MEVLLYISAIIAAGAFAFLVYYLIKTLQAMKNTLEKVTKTVEGLQKQVDEITIESSQLLQKTNMLADDIQQKSESLNTLFAAAKDIGESMQHVNASLRKVSQTVSKAADENSEQVAQAVKWGNIVLNLWEKWKEKREKAELKKAMSNTNDVKGGSLNE